MRPSFTRFRRRRGRTTVVAVALATASVLGSTIMAAPAQATVYNVPSCGNFDMDDTIAFLYFVAGAGSSAAGCPTSNTRTVPGGAGIFNHFQNGSMYWKNTDPNAQPRGVMEPIRAKWQSLGWERGLLGWPTSDTFNGTNLAGEAGTGQHFEGGRIYSSPATGTNEMHGSILTKWTNDNLFPRLGLPTTDEQDFADGGKVSHFEKGAIYWWPDTGAIPIFGKELRVSYRGIHAYEDTDDGFDFDGDEPYAIVGASWPGGKRNAKTFSYTGVDKGESRIENEPLYRGAPKGIAINTLLMEFDSGDKNKYRAALQAGVDATAKEITKLAAQIPYVGPVISAISVPLLKKAVPVIAKAINDLLGTGDDKLGDHTAMLSAKDMVVMAAAPIKTAGQGIAYKYETPNMNGSSGKYRVYFEISAR